MPDWVVRLVLPDELAVARLCARQHDCTGDLVELLVFELEPLGLDELKNLLGSLEALGLLLLLRSQIVKLHTNLLLCWQSTSWHVRTHLRNLAGRLG